MSQGRGLLLVGDGAEEEFPDEEVGGLLVLLLRVHGYVHDTHSSHIYLSRNIIYFNGICTNRSQSQVKILALAKNLSSGGLRQP